ncbi:MAG: hypothetical protein AAF667_14750 [Pseudomonadota bacterium]
MVRIFALLAGCLSLAACAPERGIGFDTLGGPSGGSQSEDVTQSFEQGAPPGVPLTAEEQALYDSLTPEQQARAREFLADGSTVASSLEGDL